MHGFVSVRCRRRWGEHRGGSGESVLERGGSGGGGGRERLRGRRRK